MPDLTDLESTLTRAIKVEVARVCEENQRILQAVERETDVVRSRTREQSNRTDNQQKRMEVQQEAIQRLLDLQVEGSEERTRRSRAFTRLVVFLVAIVTSGGGVGIWTALRSPSDDEIRKEAEPVIRAVGTSSETIEIRLQSAEAKINRLGKAVIEQQVQISDGFEFIADKIDAAHPSQKHKVEIADYPAVEAAKKKSDAIKLKKGVQKLFDEEDVFDAP